MSMFDNIKFPFLTHQQLNLDWILNEIKRVMGFFPEEGDPGTVLMKTEDGTSWEELAAVDININGVPEDTELTDTDKLIFYDLSASANRKITAPNLLNSMMSNGTPLMDGTGSAGTSKKPARYDHRHPTDTSRAPADYFQNGNLKFEHGGLNDSGLHYCKMPDGTLIQWGEVINTSVGYTEVSFPIAFANDHFSFSATPRYSPDYPVIDYRTIAQKNSVSSGVVNFKPIASTGSYTTEALADWFAIGRWK